MHISSNRTWFGKVVYPLIAGCLSLIIVQALSIVGHVGSDFRLFYQAAHRFSRDPLSVYLSGSQETLQGFLYPPPAIAIFLPFLKFSLDTGYYVFIVAIYISAILSI